MRRANIKLGSYHSTLSLVQGPVRLIMRLISTCHVIPVLRSTVQPRRSTLSCMYVLPILVGDHPLSSPKLSEIIDRMSHVMRTLSDSTLLPRLKLFLLKFPCYDVGSNHVSNQGLESLLLVKQAARETRVGYR